MRTRCAWLLALALALTGCAGGSRYWKEEVVLPDGRTLIVERAHRLGSPFDGELSDLNKPPLAIGFTIDIPLPQGGKARWIGDRSLLPLAVGLKDGTAYLVASPRTCPDYDRWGRPVPPYVFFKYEHGAWQRIPVSEFPDKKHGHEPRPKKHLSVWDSGIWSLLTQIATTGLTGRKNRGNHS